MPYNSSVAVLQTEHTRMMHRPHNLHTSIRSILNSRQSMLPITAIGLRLTVSSAQALLFYFYTQQVLPPPLKFNPAFASNYTAFSLVPRAISGHPAHEHTLFYETQQTLGRLHEAGTEGIFAVWFFLAVGFPYQFNPIYIVYVKRWSFQIDNESTRPLGSYP